MKKKLFLLFLMGMLTNSFAQFTEGFENSIPSNWTVINGSEVTTWEHVSTTVANTDPNWIHSGTGAAGISRFCCFNQDDYLITPAITVQAGVNDRISFWCARFLYDAGQGMEVTISTTTPDAAAMAPIDNIAPEVSTMSPYFKKYTYDLTGYIGQTIYMGFHAIQNESWRLGIDDVVNDAMPTTIPGCSTINYPENGATNVDPVGLLNWTAISGVDGYKITLSTTPGGAEVFDSLDVSDVTSKTIGPLELATTYYVTVTPYNNIGEAMTCTEYSFSTRSEILGDFCHSAIDLSTLTSPYTSTTTGAGDDDFGCYIWTGPDVYYKIEVPDGATLNIRQIFNDYESANTVFHGDCTNRTEIYCGIASDQYSPLNWQNTTGASQTVYWVQYGAGWSEDLNDGAYTLEWSVDNCELPAATYTTVSNCDVTPGFFINVDITSMGSLSTLHITDNQGSPMQATNATGMLQFGPYPIGTAVIVKIIDGTGASCTVTSNLITLAICPPLCSESTVITVDEVIECEIGTGPGAWDFSDYPWYKGKENLYSFTPAISGHYTVATQWDGESLEDLPVNPIGLFFKAANAVCDTDWTPLASSDFFNTPIGPVDLVAGTEYLLLFDAIETSGTYQKFKIVYYEPCENAVVSHTVITECEEGAAFYVDVNIESMGTPTSHKLWVNQTLYEDITEPGIIHLGPYPYATEISYMLTNEENSLCTAIQSGRITQLLACPNFYPACPPVVYPANGATNVPLLNSNGQAELTIAWEEPEGIDTINYQVYIGLTPTTMSLIGQIPEVDIALIGFAPNTTYYWKAIPINIFGQFLVDAPPVCELNSFTTGEFTPNGYCLNGPQGLTDIFTPLCNGTSEVVVQSAFAGYYEFVNVTEGETYTFTTNGTNPSGMPDLITIGSEDGETALAWSTSPLTWTANTTGLVRYYLHLSEMCEGQSIYRVKSVSCGSLSTPIFNISELKAYPNPTKDILNLTYINGIKDVTVLNVLGQEVITKTVNDSKSTIDMQSLSKGTYLVKINSTANESKTVKIIKE